MRATGMMPFANKFMFKHYNMPINCKHDITNANRITNHKLKTSTNMQEMY